MSVAATKDHRFKPLPRWERFLLVIVRNLALSGALILGGLVLGAWGYHAFGELPWIDAFLNASMILTGMGPVNELGSSAGKIFATFYALFSGILFLTATAVLLAPVLQRFLHRFHLEFMRFDTDARD